MFETDAATLLRRSPSLRLVYLRWIWGSLRLSAERPVPVSTWQSDPNLLSVPSTLSCRHDSCELYSHHRRPNQHGCRARFAPQTGQMCLSPWIAIELHTVLSAI